MQPFHDIAQLPAPLVAISGCLAGDNVRYDGDHKAQPLLLQTLADRVHWQHLCPEVAAGLGVPRPPVQLRRHGADIAVVEVADSTRDHTQALQGGVATVIRQLSARRPDAIVLKARSPSCGSGSTPLFNADGESIALTDGLFARACREHFSDIPLFDETALATTSACQAFAVLLLIRTDIARAGLTLRPALDAHYRELGIDTTSSQQLPQQLATWPAQRIAQAFAALWPATS